MAQQFTTVPPSLMTREDKGVGVVCSAARPRYTTTVVWDDGDDNHNVMPSQKTVLRCKDQLVISILTVDL